ncbi:MAG: acylphosphatase, partial [Gammaproteobacteria bacterium]|nr:acylphosphatase [Gammaproteobacteria bacterium]
MPNHTISRLRITISGQVQGVGFRPFCHTLAQRFNLSGWVRNHGGGVDLEIQGMNT